MKTGTGSSHGDPVPVFSGPDDTGRRQSRGASEKFHGAIIDHYGGNDTRVFKEVSKVGATLKELKELAGSTMDSPVAMIYDWDSQWAMEDSQGL